MTAAVVASDLDPLHTPTPIRVPVDRARNSVEERRPAATTIEFGCCLVQRRVAPCACVDTIFGVVLVVFTRTGHFSSLFTQDAELLGVELGTPFRVGHAFGEGFRWCLR